MKPKTRLASKAKVHATRMAERCEEWAKAADKKVETAKTNDDLIQAQDASRVYWMMAADWQATAKRAEEITPAKFNAKNKGTSQKTQEKRAFLRDVAETIGSTKRQDVVLAALETPGFSDLFDSYEAAYRVAVPAIFDGIRKPS
jgi:hypothetical protein